MSNQKKKISPAREVLGWILMAIGGLPVLFVIIKATIIGFYMDEILWMAGVFVGGGIVLYIALKVLGEDMSTKEPTPDLLATAKTNQPNAPAQGQNAQYLGYGAAQQNRTVDLLATVNTNQPFTPAQNPAQNAPNPGYVSPQQNNTIFPSQPPVSATPYGSCLQCGMKFQKQVRNFCPGCGTNLA